MVKQRLPDLASSTVEKSGAQDNLGKQEIS